MMHDFPAIGSTATAFIGFIAIVAGMVWLLMWLLET